MKTLNYISRPLFAACASATLLFVSSAAAQNVGIGISNPQAKLTVNGTTASGGIAVGDSTFNVAAPANGVIIQGFTGIGTTAPISKLHLLANGSILRDAYILVETKASPLTPGALPFVNLVIDNNSTLNPEDIMGGYVMQSLPGGAGAADGNETGWRAIHRGFTGGTPLTAMAFVTAGGTGGREVMRIDEKGNLGIGTTTPFAPLYVAGSSNFQETNVTQSFFTFNSTSTLVHGTGVTGTNVASAIFANAIWSGGAVLSYSGPLTASDARLKNIIGHSDSAKDLETLKKIEITDYTMKDVVQQGDGRCKKVIAQQVEEVYPTAIKTIGYKGVTFTPDIYAVSSSVKSDGQNAFTISLAKTHGLKDGETVRLITAKNPELNVVAHVVDDKTFTVTTKEALGDKVFVYGKQCLDLKSVDYDAIAMLNVSATQELAKKVEALEAENDRLNTQANKMAALEAENAQMKAQTSKLAAKMEALEKLMSVSNHKKTITSQTVALAR